MKTIIIAFLSIISVFITSCSKNDDNTAAILELTNLEKQDLVFLREEEKLARDVYLYAFEKYQQQIFYNISQSEQQHMNSILYLLNKYNLKDPVIEELGIFLNQDLQQLYNQLTAQIDISLIEALKVGATVEDLDIKDIVEVESNTQNIDILNVYNSLKCGSRNHLRSFVFELDFNGISYIPQFISVEEYNEIIESEKERCGG
ncbi:DUF2202 domain-containing protein [Pontimicrobium aquaticum]|uniref:DUF2202 domain-containing protein n=1 Tax=Pontimicrobium aquaticum TaxID=2565367 RepID=A0A4U0ETX4_9FLAO|nr:DUF2202 domain-containing protein [Pontimicrobium aquaticum]TJY34674.1 DUF2202 domain-containing protein [Pontimicrobium aquaticum]